MILLTAILVVVTLLIAMLVVVMLLIAMLLTAMLWFENSDVVKDVCSLCRQVMGQDWSNPFRAALPHGFCVCMYVSFPTISGDAVIPLI